MTDTYHRRCAVTGEKALPVLDAAHIRGVAEGAQHRLDDGLLLRSDVPAHPGRGGWGIGLGAAGPHPTARERPGRELLEWHGDVVFRP